MNRSLFFLVALWIFLPFAPAGAGVVIGGTRFIYEAGRASLSVPVRNTSDTRWLINSHVSDATRWPGAVAANTGPSPFWVTPPLFTLAAGQENTLRLVYGGAALPNDKESLFTLSIAAIPSGKPGSHSVQMGFRSSMKLIYRPAGLAGDPASAYRQLRWARRRNGLAVSNPTPYYVTLFSLDINGRPVDNAGVVAPFATRLIDGCAQAACQVRWQSINDDGRVMPAVTDTR